MHPSPTNYPSPVCGRATSQWYRYSRCQVPWYYCPAEEPTADTDTRSGIPAEGSTLIHSEPLKHWHSHDCFCAQTVCEADPSLIADVNGDKYNMNGVSGDTSNAMKNTAGKKPPTETIHIFALVLLIFTWPCIRASLPDARVLPLGPSSMRLDLGTTAPHELRSRSTLCAVVVPSRIALAAPTFCCLEFPHSPSTSPRRPSLPSPTPRAVRNMPPRPGFCPYPSLPRHSSSYLHLPALPALLSYVLRLSPSSLPVLLVSPPHIPSLPPSSDDLGFL
ncbi:hypothetical protein C8R44DRAFT_881842 [Mycena epipterygia]|nr:hypothetical protein C8R44DRAFT_881842 [Mycena epipterygia]